MLSAARCGLVVLAATTGSVTDQVPLKTRVQVAFRQYHPKLMVEPVFEVLRRANQAHLTWSDAEILRLDQDWRGRTPRGLSLIDQIASEPASVYLSRLVAAYPDSIREVFVMDARGVVVATSNPTSDYWQGDEPKWSRTFPRGTPGQHIGEVAYDESAGHYVVQLSFVITDPTTDRRIGAVCIGLNADRL